MASNALIHRLTSSIMSPPTFPDFVPENQALDCFALADMLEEGDRHEEATAYRWMGWWGRRPAARKWARIKKTVVWYREGLEGFEQMGAEGQSYYAQPWGHLPYLVYLAMGRRNPEYLLYQTWDEAILDLGKALCRMRDAISPPSPQTKKKGHGHGS